MNESTHLTRQLRYSNRIEEVPRSFLRDILQIAVTPGVISFAGGLPNSRFFPADELRNCADKLLRESPAEVLQYSNTEGCIELREIIADYYRQKGLDVSPERILITTGSQQALDLIGKVFINPGDNIVIEKPSYLGAIQAFSMYQPRMHDVQLDDDGINLEKFEERTKTHNPKLAYLVPNFQNPSGISYSEEKRKVIADLAEKNDLILIEDDPYGELGFTKTKRKTIYSYASEKTLLLGTFSKIVAPGLRVGWIVAPDEIYNKLVVAKQAADLHTDIFAQKLICQFLKSYPVERHLSKVRSVYKEQAHCMMESIDLFLGNTVKYTRPQGGMFMWMTLPEGMSSQKLFELTIEKKVAVVPGFPFLINQEDSNTLRLNFSCTNCEDIRTGIEALANSIYELKF